MLNKMRGKLAAFAPPRQTAAEQGPRQVRRRRHGRLPVWVWAGIVLLVAAVNWFLIDRKETLLAHVGVSGIPALPDPSRGLGVDEKALYYAYALYDFGKLREKFQVSQHFAIDQAKARQRLQELVPKVSTATLGEISKYAPMGYMAVKAGGSR